MQEAERKFWLRRIASDGDVAPWAQTIAADMQHQIKNFPRLSLKQISAQERLVARYRSGEIKRSTQPEGKPPRWKVQLKALRAAATRRAHP